MKRLLGVVLLVVSAAAVPLYVTQTTGASDAERIENWKTQIEMCVEPRENDIGDDRAIGCLEKVFADVVKNRSFRQVSPMLVELSANRDKFRGLCHFATHRLGDLVWESYPDIDQLLVDTSPRVCGDGLAHAAMEAVAAQRPDIERWVEIAKACDQYLYSTNEPGDGCSHGLGHGVLEALGENADPKAALTNCREIGSRLGNGVNDRGSLIPQSCAYGVMMQAFAPASMEMDAIDEPASVVETCQSWVSGEPATKLTEALHEGCLRGAGFALGRNVGPFLPSLNKTDLFKMTMKMISYCTEAGPYASSTLTQTCAHQTVQQAVLSLLRSEGDIAAYHKFCTEAESEVGQGFSYQCLAQTRNSITEVWYGKLAAVDPNLTEQLLTDGTEFGR